MEGVCVITTKWNCSVCNCRVFNIFNVWDLSHGVLVLAATGFGFCGNVLYNLEL